ncbi:Thrombospondin type 3 repeat-containing protein [Neolewinella agarilytica]|uniref:Thrombospondin type 3 repeat-containing protein n=2 Tax=Neolewinella agarilytica TaxID=478744 RepID=A0A1H9DWP7_9BACT|nr:Thrombospondin type 3 repeat-containing protein [Neolewinella agarilytica]
MIDMRFILPAIVVLFTSLGVSGQFMDSTAHNSLSTRMLLIQHQTAIDKSASVTTTYGIELGFHRQFNDKFGTTLPLKMAVIDQGELENANIIAFDILGDYYPIGSQRKFSPYLIGGLGFVFNDKGSSYGQFPFGAGVDLRLGTNFSLKIQLERRWAGTDQRKMNTAGIGYVYQFGGLDNSDTDGDGISDRRDNCPAEPGPRSTKGCPDADLDGVIDEDDFCPEIPGGPKTKGCPDRDNDGTADQKDRCPNQAGTREMLGCPDYDKDGVADPDDKCPAQPGKKLFQGCPDTDNDGVPDDIDPCPNDAGSLITGCPDRDKDGFHDLEDKCPDEPGKNAGCPELSPAVKASLERITNKVSFVGRSHQMTDNSYPALDDLLNILTDNPAYHLIIEGHTANDGTEENNQRLGQLQALSCRSYLVSKGIAPERIKVISRGATRPRADENTSVGKELNRRMEFLLVPGGRG